MDCDQAVALGDGRELFTVHTDFKVTSFVDDYCIVALSGAITQNNILLSQECGAAAASQDNREKWELRKLGNLKQF